MNRWTLGGKKKYNLSSKLKFYILIKELLYLSQVGWPCCRSHWVIPHSLHQMSKAVLRGEILHFKVTNSCFVNRKYPFPVAPCPMSKQKGAQISALARRKLYSIFFQPTFLKLQTVVTSYPPCRLLHPFRGEKAAGESHFIKIKTQKPHKNSKSKHLCSGLKNQTVQQSPGQFTLS